jgi:transcriptional regulator with XRE-family HTH domain
MSDELDEETTAARHQLVTRLRELRRATRLSGEELAARAGWTQSKVSKIETGRTVPQLADVRAWADAVEALPDVRAELDRLAEAALTGTTAWHKALSRGRGHRQSRIGQLEAAASCLRVYQPLVIPGLLQVPGYMRALFSFGEPLGPDDVAEAVKARMDRQTILFDERKRLVFLIGETALRWRIGGPDVMRGQLDRIAALTTAPTIELGIIPLNIDAPSSLHHGFVVFGEPGQDDDVFVSVETISDVLRIYDDRKVALYLKRFERLRGAAVYGDGARAVLRRISSELHGMQ